MPFCYSYLHYHIQWSRAMSKGANLDCGILQHILFYSVTRTKILIMHSVFSILGVRDYIHPSRKNLTEVVFSLFYGVKFVQFHKHGCLLDRVSDCYIGVSRSFATNPKGDQACLPFTSSPLPTYVHQKVTVFLRIPLNWSIDRRYMYVTQYTKFLYCCNT